MTIFGNTTQVLIDGLMKYSAYTLELSASTKIGEGPSATLDIITDEDG